MSVYLSTNFAPVAEEVTAFDLPVIGDLPKDLNGRYLRNGPNPITAPDPLTHHWFLGDGMVHGIRLRDGKAEWYRNRYVGSDNVAEAFGRPITGPDWNGTPTGANTNVGGFAGTTWAMVEGGGAPVELTYELDTPVRSPPTRRSTRRPARCTPWSTRRRSGLTTRNTSSSAPMVGSATRSTFPWVCRCCTTCR
jgi:carotenoid cleavage dioxygenase-like enzyme